MSAAEAVFGTAELVDMILASLPDGDGFCFGWVSAGVRARARLIRERRGTISLPLNWLVKYRRSNSVSASDCPSVDTSRLRAAGLRRAGVAGHRVSSIGPYF